MQLIEGKPQDSAPAQPTPRTPAPTIKPLPVRPVSGRPHPRPVPAGARTAAAAFAHSRRDDLRHGPHGGLRARPRGDRLQLTGVDSVNSLTGVLPGADDDAAASAAAFAEVTAASCRSAGGVRTRTASSVWPRAARSADARSTAQAAVELSGDLTARAGSDPTWRDCCASRPDRDTRRDTPEVRRCSVID